MTFKPPRVQAIVQPIWQEISSLWAGAEFAFYDQSLDAEGQETAPAELHRIAASNTHAAGMTGQCKHCN